MMMKYALLAGAVAIASPALAQDQVNTQAQPAPTATTQAAPAPQTAVPASPDAAAPADQTVAAQRPATEGQPAAGGGTQVAQIVTQEFPNYDADKNGSLSQSEFASWMVSLKKASDPSTAADRPQTKSWVGAAFAQADKDKNRSVSQGELTGFLSQGQS